MQSRTEIVAQGKSGGHHYHHNSGKERVRSVRIHDRYRLSRHRSHDLHTVIHILCMHMREQRLPRGREEVLATIWRSS
jgi:hypothetical protein